MNVSIKPGDVPDLPLEPFQPRNIMFPYRSFGKTTLVKRSFQVTWFNRFSWLHYDSAVDSARCFTCCKAVKEGRAVSNVTSIMSVLLP